MKSYRAELLRSANRGTLALLALCAALGVFGMINAGAQHHTVVWGFQQAAIFIATLLMGRAATVAAGDFSTGTIRPWLISVHGKSSVFLGKLAASVTIAVGFAIGCALLGYLASAAIGKPARIGDLAGATGQLIVAAIALTLFGHAAGVASRSIPVALTITIGWVLPVEHLLDGRLSHASHWLPGLVSQRLTAGDIGAGAAEFGAAAHAIIPFVIIELLVLVAFLRRDVTV